MSLSYILLNFSITSFLICSCKGKFGQPKLEQGHWKSNYNDKNMIKNDLKTYNTACRLN